MEPSLCAQVWYAVETTDREDAQLLVETLNKARALVRAAEEAIRFASAAERGQ